MKALTLTQPWASLVAEGRKVIETRSWRTRYRGTLAIHAAKGIPAIARAFAQEFTAYRVEPLPLGAVVCLIDLVDCQPTEDVVHGLSANERRFGDYTPGRWAWLFDPASLRVLPDPIPARGALSLWEWDEKPDEGS